MIRFQGGNNAGPHDRARRRDVQVPPDPVGDPVSRQAVRDRQRRRGGPAGADRGDRRPAPPEHRPERPARVGQRARDHALPPAAGPRRRGAAGQARDRHHQARHRPLLRRQGLAPGHPDAGPAGREDPAPEDRRGHGAQGAPAARLRQGPAAGPAPDDRGLPRLRRAAGAPHRRHAPHRLGRAGARPAGGVRGRPGHPPGHRPRHLSVRDLVQPGGRRRVRGRRRGTEVDRRGVGHLQGLLHPRGRRPVPVRAARRDGRPAARGRP